MALFDFIRRSSKMYFFKKVVIKFLRGREKSLNFPFSQWVVFVAQLGSAGSNPFKAFAKIAAYRFTRYIAQNAAASLVAALSP